MVGNSDEKNALALAQSFGSMSGRDLVKEVTCSRPYTWGKDKSQLGQNVNSPIGTYLHVVAYDFGIKRNMLPMLAQRGCRITVVPAHTPAQEVLGFNPDGIFLSSGPGDPEACTYAVKNIQLLLNSKKPIFGIGFGHQLLALAMGGKTRKMAVGYDGAHHPVQDLVTKDVFISRQSHSFEVDEESLPENVTITHRSLCDNSVQGIEVTTQSAFSFQGYPEDSSGVYDLAALFDKFIMEMDKLRHTHTAASYVVRY